MRDDRKGSSLVAVFEGSKPLRDCQAAVRRYHEQAPALMAARRWLLSRRFYSALSARKGAQGAAGGVFGLALLTSSLYNRKSHMAQVFEDLKIFDRGDFPKYLPKLNALYGELFSSGKGFRSRLIQSIAKHLELTSRQVVLLAQTIEFIHNASLLHDDLVDRSPLRRSKPAAWLKYSPEYSVLAGYYLLARVMVNLSRYGNLRLIQYTAEMISDLLEGEWIQDSLIHDWRVQLNQLDQVHDLKTASLFKWCLRAPFIAQRQ